MCIQTVQTARENVLVVAAAESHLDTGIPYQLPHRVVVSMECAFLGNGELSARLYKLVLASALALAICAAQDVRPVHCTQHG